MLQQSSPCPTVTSRLGEQVQAPAVAVADTDDPLVNDNVPELVVEIAPDVSVFENGSGVAYAYSVVRPQLTVADEKPSAMSSLYPTGDASCSLVAPRMQSAHWSSDEDTFRAASRTTSQYVFVSFSL